MPKTAPVTTRCNPQHLGESQRARFREGERARAGTGTCGTRASFGASRASAPSRSPIVSLLSSLSLLTILVALQKWAFEILSERSTRPHRKGPLDNALAAHLVSTCPCPLSSPSPPTPTTRVPRAASRATDEEHREAPVREEERDEHQRARALREVRAERAAEERRDVTARHDQGAGAGSSAHDPV